MLFTCTDGSFARPRLIGGKHQPKSEDRIGKKGQSLIISVCWLSLGPLKNSGALAENPLENLHAGSNR